ncbi:uncharacterized protein PV09_04114 [Verruconis gallopava]|uniref:Spt20-like SEP domain-containing protein n=1 Tax=Verruconis gallopava TaxID=253628 RepID=A0A0D2B0U4_9PEZI|nr:uncharacterized protein PV09_04114 [Verruconis gallopava]KIW04949.1 hypothetical protein PV09_04114 [Verruconis gallopava]
MATAVVTARAQPLRRHDKRPNLPRVSTRATTVEAMDSSTPLKPTPHFYTEEYILERHKNDPPSLIVHLHQNHFRFDQQDGNFSYDSEAREFLRHLKERTVPGEPFLSEFYQARVPFYTGCLIVEVHNHRTKGASNSGNTTNQVGATDHVPYSIHNYNEHITPSPFAKYPEHKSKSNVPQAEGEKKAEKEPMPAPEQPASAMQKKGTPAPQISRRVLFPTQAMWDYDLMRLSMTPMTDARSDRHGSVQPGAATPTLGQPPTPITAVPTTPKQGQRMMVDATNAKEWEAEIINYTAPKLILNPAADLESSIEIIEQLEDPLHCEEPPLPKGRKRTVAEMAAEDAQAASIERYMLSSDERHQSMLPSGAAGTADGTARTGASGEAQFKRFRLIEGLKIQQAENKRQEAEREAQRAAQKRALQEAEARKAREAQEHQKQQAALQAPRHAEILHRQQQLNQQRAVAAQQAAAAQQVVTTSAQPMSTSAPQHAVQQAAQANHMSPIVRQQTPMSASPTLGGGTPMSSAAITSVPMTTSMSNQGAGSPPRPASAVQHPGGGVNMMRQASQQASAHGTPQMHSTPSMASAAPVTRHMTPQPRVNQHGSPMPNPMATPQMMNMTPVPNGITPEQQQMMMRQRMAQAQAQANQQGMNAMSPAQMNPMMRMQSQMANNPQLQQANMTPQMMNQARMMQAQAANQAAAAAAQQQQNNPQMASINQALTQIMTGLPPPITQRLMTLRSQAQTEIANQEQLRKQQFLAQFQQMGMQPPQEAIAQWQVNNQRMKMEAFQQLRQKLIVARQNLLQSYQASMAQQGQQVGANAMSPQVSNAGQNPGTQQAQMQGQNMGNQQYMQQLMQQQRRLQAAQVAQAQAQAMAQAQQQQGGGGGQQQRMMQPGQGIAQMNPQMMAQMQMQGMNPAQQQAFMQQMRMQQMQNQTMGGMNAMNAMNMSGQQGGGFANMNGSM